MKLLIIFVMAVTVYGKPAVRVCPSNFDYSVKNSCFKYVNDQLLQHGNAEKYCREELGGKLAVLDSHLKVKKTMEFFHTIFDEEFRMGGKPTAWVAGEWVKGTRHLRYNDGAVNTHPKWMTPIFNNRTRKMFRWPTEIMFGENATCVVASLWKKVNLSLDQGEVSGLYNVECDGFYFTHPLCEVAN